MHSPRIRRAWTSRLAQVVVVACLLPACTFHRTQSNAYSRELDVSSIAVGASTWRDVLNELGPPSGSTTEKITASLTSMASFRYACADEKQFTMLLAYFLYLPFKWTDKQSGYELIVEFTPRGVVSDLYAVQGESVWRPFQAPRERWVHFYDVPTGSP